MLCQSLGPLLYCNLLLTRLTVCRVSYFACFLGHCHWLFHFDVALSFLPSNPAASLQCHHTHLKGRYKKSLGKKKCESVQTLTIILSSDTNYRPIFEHFFEAPTNAPTTSSLLYFFPSPSSPITSTIVRPTAIKCHLPLLSGQLNIIIIGNIVVIVVIVIIIIIITSVASCLWLGRR